MNFVLADGRDQAGDRSIHSAMVHAIADTGRVTQTTTRLGVAPSALTHGDDPNTRLAVVSARP